MKQTKQVKKQRTEQKEYLKPENSDALKFILRYTAHKAVRAAFDEVEDNSDLYIEWPARRQYIMVVTNEMMIVLAEKYDKLLKEAESE